MKSKGHVRALWLVDFDRLCQFLYFCGQAVVAVIMITTLKLANRYLGFEVQSPYVFERHSINNTLKTILKPFWVSSIFKFSDINFYPGCTKLLVLRRSWLSHLYCIAPPLRFTWFKVAGWSMICSFCCQKCGCCFHRSAQKGKGLKKINEWLSICLIHNKLNKRYWWTAITVKCDQDLLGLI